MDNKKVLSAKISQTLMFVALTWLVIAFLYLPNLNLLKEIFMPKGELSLSSFSRLISSARAMNSLKNSFILAFASIVSVNIMGIFLAFMTEYFKIKGGNILRLGYMTPLIYRGIVLVAGYKFVYGSNGAVTKIILNYFPNVNPNWFMGFAAVLMVFTFSQTSNHMIFLSNAMKKIDYQTVEAARNMGASQWYIVKNVVLPVLKPNIFSLTVLVFIAALGATAFPLMVGGDNFQTIGPMILTFAQMPSARDLAAVLALFLGLATAVLLAIMTHFEKKGNYMSVSKVKTKMVKQPINNKILNIIAHIICYIIFVMYMLPMLLVILFSFTNAKAISTGIIKISDFTIANYMKVFNSFQAMKPFITSILYSAAASIIVVLLMLLVSRLLFKYKNKFTVWLEYSLLIPWVLPSVLIAIALITTFDRKRMIVFNSVLSGTIWILLIAYIIIKIPFSLRMLKSSFYAIDTNLEEAARSLGAGPIYTFFKIILPIVLPSALAVAAINFNTLIADYDLTVFLYHPLNTPLGIVIRNATEGGETLGDSQALLLVYSVIIMIISSVTLYFVYGKGKENIDE